MDELPWHLRKQFNLILWVLQDNQSTAYYISEDYWCGISPNSWEFRIFKSPDDAESYLKIFDFEYFYLECWPDFELGLFFFLETLKIH